MKDKQKRGIDEGTATSDWRSAAHCGISLLTPAAKYREVAKSQKLFAEEVAAKIESEQPLSLMERTIAAGAIRAHAASIPAEQPKKRGQSPEFCHGSEAMVFVGLRVQGLSPDAAYANIADRVGVSEQAVAKAMRNHAPGAARLLEECLGMAGIPDNLFRK